MLSQARIYVAAIVAALMVLAAAIVYVQKTRIGSLKTEIEQLQGDVAVAVAVNADNAKTIQELRGERDRVIDSCAARMAEKDRTITKLREIVAATTGGDNEQVGVDTVVGQGGVGAVSDSVHVLLGGMLPCSPRGDEDRVRAVPSESAASGARVSAGDVEYRLDRDNALRLVANIALVCGWARDMREILMREILRSVQTGTN